MKIRTEMVLSRMLGWQLCLPLLFLVYATVVSAGQVHNESLRDALKSTRIIVVAEVLESPTGPIKPTENSALVWVYRMKVSEVIVGSVGREVFTMTFAEPDFSKMATEGSLMFSPIVHGSGLEKTMQIGERYILLFSSPYDLEKANDQPAHLTRAEPVSEKQEVLSLWLETTPH